jgi:hypothetical protein
MLVSQLSATLENRELCQLRHGGDVNKSVKIIAICDLAFNYIPDRLRTSGGHGSVRFTCTSSFTPGVVFYR